MTLGCCVLLWLLFSDDTRSALHNHGLFDDILAEDRVLRPVVETVETGANNDQTDPTAPAQPQTIEANNIPVRAAENVPSTVIGTADDMTSSSQFPTEDEERMEDTPPAQNFFGKSSTDLHSKPLTHGAGAQYFYPDHPQFKDRTYHERMALPGTE